VRRGVAWEGSAIKGFHDIHLDGGVEQGHKDGLACFVDSDGSSGTNLNGEIVDPKDVLEGANFAIDAMHEWWSTLLSQVSNGIPEKRVRHGGIRRYALTPTYATLAQALVATLPDRQTLIAERSSFPLQ
jgi:hypothetical protein